MVDDASHYRALAACYARGALGRLALDDEAALAAGVAAELRLHRFKRTAGLPRVRAVLGALRGLGPATICDVGSGRGAFLWPMLDELPAVEVITLDLLPHRVADLAAVAKGGVARLRAVRTDIERAGLASDVVDVVTLLEVLEHVRDPAAAAAEALRLARRAVIVTVPSVPDDNPEHVRLFDKASLTALFVGAGARRVAVDGVRGHLVAVIHR